MFTSICYFLPINTLATLRLLKVDMLLTMQHKEHKVDSQGTFLTRILKLDIHALVLEMTLCLRLLLCPSFFSASAALSLF
jgi:hypothetical protein